MIQWTSGSTIQCATGSMNQRNNPHEWLTDWLADWMNGWMNERIKESMNHCINEPNSQWTNELCKPLPRSQQLSGIWSGNRTLAIQSRSHFANFIFQKCSEHASFLIFLRSPASTRPHLGLIFQVLWACHFVYDFYVKSSSRYSLVHILPTSSPKSAPIPADPLIFCTLFISLILLWRPHPKKHRVSRPRLFSPVNSHASELLHSHDSGWLTWWWEC